ncbi:MAG: acyl carrier protein [Gemmatimonadota bacterium]
MNQDIDARLERVFLQVLGPTVTVEIGARPDRPHARWDSIAHISLVMAIEQEFQVLFSPEEAGMTTTLQALKDTLAHKLGI